MKNLRVFVGLILGFVVLPCYGQAKASSAPVPWPWPWAVGCPIKWNELAHSYTLPDVIEGSQLSLTISRVQGSSFIGVHIRRSDTASGVHSDGFALVPRNKRNVVVYMTPERASVKPYAIRIAVYLYQSYHLESCETDRLATVLSIESLHRRHPSGKPDYNYVLDMAAIRN